ncbi:MAG TPA: TonB family protein [Cellvibrionaceae bacterium]
MRKLLWITSVLTLLALPLQAATLLNGIAVHQELGRDQFIGAVYSDTLTDNADVLLAGNQSLRMELKVTAENGLTARRFSRLWVEGMAINNSPDVLTAQADNMVAFTNLFKGRLNTNDHVIFNLTPGEGVDITVNGVELGTIADDEFFSLLLSAWVGRVPLSSTFRENLLVAGEVDSGLISRYESILPSSNATARIAAWIAPPPAPAPTPTPVPAPEPVPEPEPEVAETQAPSRPAIDIEMPAIAGLPQRPPRADTAPVDEPAPETAPAPEPIPEPVVASTPEVVTQDEEDEEALPLFTAESLLANQRYFSNMMVNIQRNLTYPRRAAQRGQEGSLRVAVVIDRNGNLLSAEILEESRHALLNREAMSKIEELSPYPAIPDTIPGRTHEFTIPITFALAAE